ncbi:MAG: hypothetical protein H6650_03300 [Ardenticatenales bacterium]|nr:hypothetical protein [Ardenticatenales bacterium]
MRRAWLLTLGLCGLLWLGGAGGASKVAAERGRTDGPFTHLQVGESATVDVRAETEWNWSGLLLLQGESYALSVDPQDWWLDWFVVTNADGFTRENMVPFEPFRRMPDEQWFALIGAIGQSLDDAFLIGTEATYTVTTSGLFYSFANDMPAFYFNNHGHVQLTITRLD